MMDKIKYLKSAIKSLENYDKDIKNKNNQCYRQDSPR